MTIIEYRRTDRVSTFALDTERLAWRLGHPSHDPDREWLQWSNWRTVGWTEDRPQKPIQIPICHLVTAIVSDAISAYRGGGDTGQPYETRRVEADYAFVDTAAIVAEGWRPSSMHYPRVAWRMLRAWDGRILYDSLADASPAWRVVPHTTVVGEAWAHASREACNRGDLPPQPYVGSWFTWP